MRAAAVFVCAVFVFGLCWLFFALTLLGSLFVSGATWGPGGGVWNWRENDSIHQP
jgi:hypothetical protein